MKSLTSAEFANYLEDCCRNGAVYGGVFFHMSADDRIRWAQIRGTRWASGAEPTRTTLQPVTRTLFEITEWREKTAKRVARKITTGTA